jgi:hypothetical protein
LSKLEMRVKYYVLKRRQAMSQQNQNECSLVLSEKTLLSDLNIKDLCLMSKLPPDAKPLKPLPPDPLADVIYKQFMEPKCVVCRSPYRTVAEHVYLENARRPNAVVNFFAEYLGARIIWESVDTHMKRHCDLSHITTPGLKKIESSNEANVRWQYRELELAMALVTDEIDELKGINVKDISLRIKLSQQLEKLSRNLVDMSKLRDEKLSTGNISILAILKDIWDEIECANCKLVIQRKVKELQSILLND